MKMPWVPPATAIEVFRQPVQRLITLKDFMPKGFLLEDDVSLYIGTCYATHAEDETSEENLEAFGKSSTSSKRQEKMDHGDDDSIANIPVHLNLSDVLLLLNDGRLIVAHVLTNPTQHKGEVPLNDKEEKLASCMTTITFIDEDL